MVRKIFIGLVLSVLISNSFAGYTSGGHSGFSGGSRSFSSSSYSRSYSTGRSGYIRSSTASRPYIASRSTYSRSYSTSTPTVIHNNHYSHPGYGFNGGGFFNGFLGGYLGGALASNHHTTVLAGTSPVIGAGQGPLIDAPIYPTSASPMTVFMASIGWLTVIVFLIMGIMAFIKFKFDRNSQEYNSLR